MGILDRYKDIEERSGFSNEVVRAVIKAICDSTYDSISHGEEVTIPGLCRIEPIKKSILEDGKASTCLDAKIYTSTALKNRLSTVNQFAGREEIADRKFDDGIAVVSISALM